VSKHQRVLAAIFEKRGEVMTYKGYQSKVELDEEAGVFHGEVINTRDVITFQGTSVEELKQAFEDSVDDYLEFCASRGEDPEKPFSGKFLIRVSPEMHRQIMTEARRQGKSLNTYVLEKLQPKTDHAA
jgi:predicted HicB family RNase H-like nuclease